MSDATVYPGVNAGAVLLVDKNGNAIGASNPMIIADQVRSFTIAGQAFSATSGKLTSLAGTSILPFQLFNPANSGKTMLIYSIVIVFNSSNVHDLRMTTQDISVSGVTGWTTASMSVTNNRGGSGNPSSVATCNYSSTTVTGLVGITRETTGTQNAVPVEVLTNGECIVLASSTSINGIALYLNSGAANNFGVTFEWIEF